MRLHTELALAEVRRPLTGVAVAVGALALMASTAAAVVLIAAGVAPFVGARWEHLAIAGGGARLMASWPSPEACGRFAVSRSRET